MNCVVFDQWHSEEQHVLRSSMQDRGITLLHWDSPANHLFRVILLVKLLGSHPVRQFISNNDVLGHDGAAAETNRSHVTSEYSLFTGY